MTKTCISVLFGIVSRGCAAEMHPFEIRGRGYADVKIVDPEEKMINYQGRLLRVFGTQRAASGVLAISL